MNRKIIKASELDLKPKTIKIKRITKVNKGGRRFRSSALVALGDSVNTTGIGLHKAKEVPEALEKAKHQAQKSLVKINHYKGTIPHAITCKYKKSVILLKPAPMGTGIIAGGTVRIILELAGISNIVAKVRGSNNPCNIAKAVIKALKQLKTPQMVMRARGLSPRPKQEESKQ